MNASKYVQSELNEKLFMEIKVLAMRKGITIKRLVQKALILYVEKEKKVVVNNNQISKMELKK